MIADLCEKLIHGATVVTPTQRLARHIKQVFDKAQIQSGRKAWIGADVLSWSAWLERTYFTLTFSLTQSVSHQILLSPTQEIALWRQVIEASPHRHDLLDVPSMARLACDAWGLQSAWRLDFSDAHQSLSEDARAYQDWAREFDARCRRQGYVSRAHIHDEIAQDLKHRSLRETRHLVLYAFDELSVQESALLDACCASGIGVERITPQGEPARCRRREYRAPMDQIVDVARRIRVLLESSPDMRIGVVVSDLATLRTKLTAVFDDVLEPSRVLDSNPTHPRPYNVSVGVSLSRYAPVYSALQMLQLTGGELPLTEIGSLLRSPFLFAGEREFNERALLDAVLRKQGALNVSAERLCDLVFRVSGQPEGVCRMLAQRLSHWQRAARIARDQKQLPSGWSDTFLSLLSSMGWPGERALNSEEYQVVQRFRELIRDLSSLDSIAGSLNFREALSSLSRMASETQFQAESEEVSVQVLGVLESAGVEFDYLFVIGMQDTAWPLQARANPLLPVAMQRARNFPHATTEWELGFAQRMMTMWHSTAGSVTYTYATQDEDLELRPSRLLESLDDDNEPPLPAWVSYAETVQQAARWEFLADQHAPSLPRGYQALGGAAVLQHQAACPFLAFAAHRLGARALEEGRSGLDARERGALLHRILALFYSELSSHQDLISIDHGTLRATVDQAVIRGLAFAQKERPDVLTPAFFALERDRLREMLLRFVDVERKRAAFRVIAREQERTIEIGGLSLNARVDRIDEIEDGRRVVIDYKTSDVSTERWWGDRPDEPQLPLYAVTDAGEVAAVSFAVLRPDRVVFKGLGSETGLLPGVATLSEAKNAARAIGDWPTLFKVWRTALALLADEFLCGYAPVAPKAYPRTCAHCDLSALCRVKELLMSAARDEEVEDE